MFKNFNWKRYAVRVFITWCFLAFILGVISGGKGSAQEENQWVYAGKNVITVGELPVNFQYYILRGHLFVNEYGNAVMTVKYTFGELGETVLIVEFDCEKDSFRIIKRGSSLEAAIDVVNPIWIGTSKNSASDLMFKVACMKKQ